MTNTMFMMLPLTILMIAILVVPPVVVKLSKRANERVKMMERLTLIVTYRCFNKKRDEFMAEMKRIQMAENSRKEAGCLMYEYFPSVEDENVVVLIEKWENESFQVAHKEATHFLEYSKIKDEYVMEMSVDKYYK